MPEKTKTLREAAEEAADELRRLLNSVGDEDFASIGDVLVHVESALSAPDPLEEAVQHIESLLTLSALLPDHEWIDKAREFLARMKGGGK